MNNKLLAKLRSPVHISFISSHIFKKDMEETKKMIQELMTENIIEQSEYFSPSLYENNDNDLRLVGWLGEFECYLDIHLEPWQILLSWDKSTTRDIKLNNILSDCIEVEKEKKIKVIP